MLDMAREFFERLVTVFDCTEAVPASRFCLWLDATDAMYHGLAIALFVERDGCPELPGSSSLSVRDRTRIRVGRSIRRISSGW